MGRRLTGTNMTRPCFCQGQEGGPEELWLVDVGQEAAGVYTCEVTTEAPPTFLTANVSFTVTVIGMGGQCMTGFTWLVQGVVPSECTSVQ